MSPPGNTGPEDKPEGLAKYIQRMKTVLRPRATKRQSVALMPETTTAPSSSAVYDLLSPATNIPDDANRDMVPL